MESLISEERLVSLSLTGRETLDTDTRIFRAHEETRSLCHNIKNTFAPPKHTRMCVIVRHVCVCECVIASGASSRRARQLMGGVNGPNSRVHIWKTLKQVVVQRCGSHQRPQDRSKTA